MIRLDNLMTELPVVSVKIGLKINVNNTKWWQNLSKNIEIDKNKIELVDMYKYNYEIPIERDNYTQT